MCHSIAILILVHFYFVVSAGPGAGEYVEKGVPDFEYLRLEWTQIIFSHMNVLVSVGD